VTDRGHRQQEVVRFGVDDIGQQVDTRKALGSVRRPLTAFSKPTLQATLPIRQAGYARRWGLRAVQPAILIILCRRHRSTGIGANRTPARLQTPRSRPLVATATIAARHRGSIHAGVR
jgi:hypothetical protein